MGTSTRLIATVVLAGAIGSSFVVGHYRRTRATSSSPWREAASGAKVTPAKRREAEDELLRATTTALAPWAERRAAARLAIEDARLGVAASSRSTSTSLLTDLAAEGQAVAQKLGVSHTVVARPHGCARGLNPNADLSPSEATSRRHSGTKLKVSTSGRVVISS